VPDPAAASGRQRGGEPVEDRRRRELGIVIAVTETFVPEGAPTVAPARPDPTLDDGDHERMSHIVLEGFKLRKGRFVPAGTNVVEGMVTGTPVRALCGKVWVPGRDPTRYPLCPTCREIALARGWRLPAS
jgi:hypothetical protein